MQNQNKEEKLVFEGLITESFRNGWFRVLLDKKFQTDNKNIDIILGYISGKIRRGSIRILPGDRVQIEVSSYNPRRGRIIYRLPINKASENPDNSSENSDNSSENPNNSSENSDNSSENPNKASEN